MPSNMEQVAQFRNAMAQMAQGTYKAEGDLIDYSLYDTAQLLSTALEHRLFTVGVGQVDPITAVRKDFADTNVEGNLALPTGQKLMIERIKLMYIAAEVRTTPETMAIYAMLNQTVLNFHITGKDTYGRFVLTEMFNIPFSAIVQDAATNSQSNLTSGRALGVFPLSLPIVLASLTSFNITLTHTVAPAAGLDGDRILVSLNGVLGRLS